MCGIYLFFLKVTCGCGNTRGIEFYSEFTWELGGMFYLWHLFEVFIIIYFIIFNF